MNRILEVFIQLIWPPKAPVTYQDIGKEKRWWVMLCILNIIPFTAIFHHFLFYRPSCMLNAFGADYTIPVVLEWLSRDPSLPWAIILTIVIYHIGNIYYWLRILFAPVFLSFLPLSIWIWDIPFTNRYICSHFHDHRVMILPGLSLSTKHFYLLGILLYIIFILYLLLKRRKTRTGNTS